jgi:effector-binding domain-containing protein
MKGVMAMVAAAGIGLGAAQAVAADSTPIVVEVAARPMLYVPGQANVTDPAAASKALGAAYGKILTVIGPMGLEVDGPPIAINRAFDPQGMWEFDAALVVKSVPEGESPDGAVKIGQTPAGRVVKVVHTGPYSGMKSAYDAIEAYMKAHSLKPGALSWEEYVSDPGDTPADKLITNVYFQVAP